MSISMMVVLVLVVAGLVFVSVFATERLFAPATHGKRVLKRELRSRGVDPERLGEECLDALVAQCIDAPRAEDHNEGRKFWAAFKESLKAYAGKVAAVLDLRRRPLPRDALGWRGLQRSEPGLRRRPKNKRLLQCQRSCRTG